MRFETIAMILLLILFGAVGGCSSSSTSTTDAANGDTITGSDSKSNDSSADQVSPPDVTTPDALLPQDTATLDLAGADLVGEDTAVADLVQPDIAPADTSPSDVAQDVAPADITVADTTVADTNVADTNVPDLGGPDLANPDALDVHGIDVVVGETPFDCNGVTPVNGTPTLALQTIETGLGDITSMAFAPGDTSRLFVTIRNGWILIIKDGKLMPNHKFLDLNGPPIDYVDGSGEQGLLNIVFHPNFPTDKRFYVYYTRQLAQNELVVEVVEYKDGGSDLADTATRKLLLTIPEPAGNHNGGSMQFGPDGYLYISVGDGGGSGDNTGGPLGNAQDMQKWLGKILRIDVDGTPDQGKAYRVPPDNPFVNQQGVLPEIFHFGLRNPYRASFDALTGDYWIGDVGQNAYEEISMAPAGSKGLNFGWRCKEASSTFFTEFPQNTTLASHCASVWGMLVDPIVSISQQDSGFRSVMGGYVYRGCKMPGYRGHYFYGDYSKNRLYRFTPAMTSPLSQGQINAFTLTALTSFAQDAEGELYLGTLGGNVYKLVPAP